MYLYIYIFICDVDPSEIQIAGSKFVIHIFNTQILISKYLSMMMVVCSYSWHRQFNDQ